MRSYVSSAKDCNNCKYRAQCFSSKSEARKIMWKPWQEFQDNAHNRVGNPEYDEIMILQQVVCEGNFALQKRCHNLRFTYFRGIEKVSIQCPFSASILNLKRLVKYGNISEIPDIKAAKAALISDINLFVFYLLNKEIFSIGCLMNFNFQMVLLSTDPIKTNRYIWQINKHLGNIAGIKIAKFLCLTDILY